MQYMFGPLAIPPLPSSTNTSSEILYPFPHNVTFYTADWMDSTRSMTTDPNVMENAENNNAAVEKEDREGYDVVLAYVRLLH
jgi:hypothetical protein